MSEKFEIKIKIIISFIFILFFILNRTIALISIKIFISPGFSPNNQKFWVGEKHEIIFSKFPVNSNEKIYLTSKNNKVIIFKDYFLITSNGTECLMAYANINAINSKICFNIYNTPELNFKESNPIKIETNTCIKLNLESQDYPISNIKYQSSNSDIIKIDNEGIVTAVRPGKSIITASGSDGKKTEIVVSSISDNGLITNTTLDIYNAEFYKNVMIVAHPDDEILWGGANLYKESYFVVCITNGYNLKRANDFREILKFTKNGGIILNYPDTQNLNYSYIQDDWSEVKNGILKDLSIIIGYKNWEKIVTHGPDGTTGHPHHKKVNNYVTKIAKDYNKYSILYYFEKFYEKNKIPLNLQRISDKDLQIKKIEIKIHKTQRKSLFRDYFHSIPYEKFILASNWKKQ